jgi:hypothetical protein
MRVPNGLSKRQQPSIHYSTRHRAHSKPRMARIGQIDVRYARSLSQSGQEERCRQPHAMSTRVTFVQARVGPLKQAAPCKKTRAHEQDAYVQHCASMACGPVNGMMGTMCDRTIVEDLVADERDACHPQPCVREPVEPHSHVASLFLSHSLVDFQAKRF